jgi:D-alanine-D-alanine ligase-like ATP-grasp enzyme
MPEVKDKKLKRVGILRGGAGKNYASSLKKGGEIILHISENLSDKYKPVDILIDKDSIWHLNGLPINPSDLVNKVDVVWNTTQPSFSNILESLSIPNIGVSSFFHALENDKNILREHLKNINLLVPRFIISPKSAREVLEKFPSPWIVKNYNEIKLVKTFNELSKAINGNSNLTVEEFIAGKVATLHSAPKFRGQDVYTFPLGNTFGNFSAEEKEKLVKLAKDLHKQINAKHYLKSNFVLSPRGKVYLLSIESMPDLKPDSHFFQVCESVGTKTHHVIEHILEQAL